jgi:hypothetical protein
MGVLVSGLVRSLILIFLEVPVLGVVEVAFAVGLAFAEALLVHLVV